MKRRRSIRDYIGLLHKYFQLDKPVRVRVGKTALNKERYPFQRDSGSASENENGFFIMINKGSTRNDKVDTLMHEWAHCRVDWTDGDEHSDRWGIEFARIRRVLIDEIGMDDEDKDL